MPRRRSSATATTTTTTTTVPKPAAAAPAAASSSSGKDPLTSWAVAAALPELQKPWPQGCEQFWRSRDAPPRPQVNMRSAFFPLLQVDELVQCRSCKRPIARDAHDAHLRECLALPTAERMAAEEAALSAAAIRAKNKSPQKDPGERPKSGMGNGSEGSRHMPKP